MNLLGSGRESLAAIPAVHRFLDEPAVRRYEFALGRENVKRAIAGELDDARSRVPLPEYEALLAGVIDRLERERTQTLLETINATGVMLHTNLGRAPLAPPALDAIRRTGGGYSNLEFDLQAGTRGSRHARVTALLTAITGAPDALVVNNCAAAVLLILDTLAKGREAIVARNQLIEIGGGFRLPDVLERSGARLVEVGATNKVYLRDYERALTPNTALLLRSHPSNYRISGFTHDVPPEELAALGKRVGVPVVEDLGSGALVDLAAYGLPHERTVQDAVRDGIDAVAFSGDKLLGGPQAGIVVGTAALIARLRDNPLLRALRVDKSTIAALGATLRLYLSADGLEAIPLYRMLGASQRELRSRAQRYVDELPALLGACVVESSARVGGGCLPETEIASIAVSLRPPGGADAFAARLRRGEPALVGRIENGALLLDLRTVAPEQDAAVVTALQAAIR